MTAIECLKSKNAGDRIGVRAEDIKEFDDETKEMMTEMFNDVNKQDNMTAEAWRKVVIKRDSKKEMTREGSDATFKLKIASSNKKQRMGSQHVHRDGGLRAKAVVQHITRQHGHA